MDSRSTSIHLGLALVLVLLWGGCSPGEYLAEQRAEALHKEIVAMAADRSSTQDSDCAVVDVIEFCQPQPLVYSRLTVDEDLLLDKIREYNDLQEFIFRQYHPPCPANITAVAPDAGPTQAISVNGVCTLR